ncbi:MAG: low molecular weight protein-tyrosine-phosphatase [Gammaproteobacteria bacterium]
MSTQVGVLFVCLGNICRSPTAEGVFRARVAAAGLADRIRIDSAGTAGWHAGKPPDARSIRYAAQRGIDISALRARQVAPADFLQFDVVLAMDNDNREALLRMAPPAQRHKVALFLDHAPAAGVREVPDPYYGGAEDFARVLDLVEQAADGLLGRLRERLA